MDWAYMSGTLLRDLGENRLRRLLSILGVIIGTAAVISSLAVIEGGRNHLFAQLEKLGANIVFLEDRYEPELIDEAEIIPPEGEHARKVIPHDQTRLFHKLDTLTLEDIDFLRARFPGIRDLSPQMLKWSDIKLSGGRPLGTWIEGSTSAGAHIRRLTMREGRYLCDNDVAQAQTVCVLGASMAEKLFRGKPALGNRITVFKTSWEVIGVLNPKGSLMRFDYDELVILPLTAMQERSGIEVINAVLASGRDSASARKLRSELPNEVLALLRDHEAEDLRVFCQDELMEQKGNILKTFKVLMVSIAAFSLLVSGIGIMNIMLVSVRERTRDIGVWKAVGATDEDVLGYFLAESVLTCMIGGVLGVFLGMFLGARATGFLAGTISEADGWLPTFRPEHILLALATTIVVGLASGIFPAYIAARLEPSEALRYE